MNALRPFLSICSSLLLVTLVMAPVHAASVEDYARLPAFSNPQLSPDGKKIAATVIYQGKSMLITRSLVKDPSQPGISAIRVGDLHLHAYEWVNNERLVVSARSSFKRGKYKRNITRMAAVNFDGSDAKFLPMHEGMYGYKQYPYILDPLYDDPDWVIAELDREPEGIFGRLHKVNVYTGKKKLFQKNNNEIISWLTDEDGELRIGISYDYMARGTKVRVWHKPKGKKNFALMQRGDYFDNARIKPQFFDENDPNILVYFRDDSFDEGADSNDYFDRLEAMNVETGEQLGAYVYTARQSIMDAADQAFPDDVVVDVGSQTPDKRLAIVSVYSDVTPKKYFLYDREKDTFSFLADTYPQLKDVPMTPMHEFDYTARDGLTIPAFLTLPAGRKFGEDAEAGTVPLIVMPHGGPWARDYWGFDNYVQFFASRGYAVFQPQYRGSTGFGIAHEEAGYGEWGNAIQDDITDGVQWLIDEGYADPDRICIFGGSFGGYAAAMGAVKTPDLYQCAVSLNGVHNLPKKIEALNRLLFSTINKYLSNRYGDARQFSPYHLADQVSIPMLIIAGDGDTVVDVDQSRSFHQKLQKLEKDVQYIELKDAEHWGTNENHQLKVLRALDAFLAQHLR